LTKSHFAVGAREVSTAKTFLVKLLQKRGCRAVRIPVSNPSLSPLPDVIARKDSDVYAFEVKNASYYAYFPKQQIDKLFRFLNELIPLAREQKHAVVAAHLGRDGFSRRSIGVNGRKIDFLKK